MRKIIIFKFLFLIFSSEVIAIDTPFFRPEGITGIRTFVLGGEIWCQGKSNSHAIVVRLYPNKTKDVLYSVYEREDTGSFSGITRRAGITKDSDDNPIIFMYKTEEYTSFSWKLKSEDPLIYAVHWERLVRFCNDD